MMLGTSALPRRAASLHCGGPREMDCVYKVHWEARPGDSLSHPSSFGRLGQKDYKVKTSSGNLAKHCLEIKTKK